MVWNRRWLAAGLAATCAWTPAASAWAKAPLAASVQAIVSSAEKAYGAGQFERASELFEQGWKATPPETTLLYNAARAAQMAKQLERAATLYEQYLGLQDQDAKFLDKAKTYQIDVRAAMLAAKVEEGRAKAKDAEQLQRDKRYSEAASTYRDAFRLDGGNLDYLFRAGLAAVLGCDEQMARLYLGDYLKQAPADAADRSEAATRLASLDKSCKDGQPRQVVEQRMAGPVTTIAINETSGAGRTSGIVTTIGGVVMAGAGAVLYGLASSDNTNLQGKVQSGWSLGVVTEISYDDAVAQKAAIESRMTTGAVLLGVGGAVAVTGAVIWALSGKTATVAVVPAPRGLSLAMRF